MGLGDKLASIFDVVLRVPPLFIVDQIFMAQFGQIPFFKLIDDSTDPSLNIILASAPSSNSVSSSSLNNSADDLFHLYSSDQSTGNQNVTQSFSEPDFILLSNTPYVNYILLSLLYLLCLFISTCVFLLPTKSLFIFYSWLTSIYIVYWSYIWNEAYVKYIMSIDEASIVSQLFQSYNMSTWFRLAHNYLTQIILSLSFCYISSYIECMPGSMPRRFAAAHFIAPTVISLLPSSLPSGDSLINYPFGGQYFVSYESLYNKIRSFALVVSPSVSRTFAITYLSLNVFFSSTRIISSLIDNIKWCKTIANHYGFYTLVENQWARLHVPQVLRVFWLTRLTQQAVMMFASSTSDSYHETGLILLAFNATETKQAIKSLVTRGCETTMAVLGMTSVISSISNQIGSIIAWFLAVEDTEDRNIGTVSALLFFILSLQTGITSMEPEKRFIRLYRNLCLLSTAILHFIHNSVNPLLNSLSASRNMSIHRHVRALSVCIFLIAFPAWFLTYLWTVEKMSTWLLAVSAFSIEVIIKV